MKNNKKYSLYRLATEDNEGLCLPVFNKVVAAGRLYFMPDDNSFERINLNKLFASEGNDIRTLFIEGDTPTESAGMLQRGDIVLYDHAAVPTQFCTVAIEEEGMVNVCSFRNISTDGGGGEPDQPRDNVLPFGGGGVPPYKPPIKRKVENIKIFGVVTRIITTFQRQGRMQKFG